MPLAQPRLPGTVVLSRTYRLVPGGQLTQPQAIRLPLSRAVPAGEAVVVATAESRHGPWAYLPARLAPDRRAVMFTIMHHSFFTVIGLDLSALTGKFETLFLNGLNGGVTTTVTPPSCADQAAARMGYQVQSSSGSAVYWCLGMTGAGQRILRVVNNRRYPLAITHLGMTVAEQPSLDLGQLSSLSHFLSGVNSIVAPGDQIGYAVSAPPGGQQEVQTQVDGFGEGLYAVQTAVDTFIAILTRFGVANPRGAVKAVSSVLGNTSCADAVWHGDAGAVMAGCFSAADLVRTFGTAGVLLAPIAAAGAVVAFFESEWQATRDSFTQRDSYTITVSHERSGIESCGTIRDGITNQVLAVRVIAGTVTCQAAMHIVSSYYRTPPNQIQGSGGFARIGSWQCSSASGTTFADTGHAGDCYGPQGAHISMDRPLS